MGMMEDALAKMKKKAQDAGDALDRVNPVSNFDKVAGALGSANDTMANARKAGPPSDEDLSAQEKSIRAYTAQKGREAAARRLAKK